ncbi:MAG: type II toxin-antitoxin system RelE/ParE family toxin [bacterium]|nr:type II toxin-antitoxin system RelE/ParE family toxin [bacterium]
MWSLEYSAEAERDFELIFDHLYETYVEFGDDPEAAIERASVRIRSTRSSTRKLVMTPYIGTLRPDIRPELRFLRMDKVAIWFLPVEERQNIIVVALFFGAQDHIRHMMARMLDNPDSVNA